MGVVVAAAGDDDAVLGGEPLAMDYYTRAPQAVSRMGRHPGQKARRLRERLLGLETEGDV